MLLTSIQYFVFFVLIFISILLIYNNLTTLEERKYFRTKLAKQIFDKKKIIEDKNKESPFQKKLKDAGIRITSLHYMIGRILLISTIFVYYIFQFISDPYSFNMNYLLVIVFFIWATEPTWKYTLINFIVAQLISKRQRKKQMELFSLFDLFKADLSSLNSNERVNVYHILYSLLPLLNTIGGSVARFLSLWKNSPDKARLVFEEEIGGNSAKNIGQILFKLDQEERDVALTIVESESEIFANEYYESKLQTAEKVKNFYFAFFFATLLLIISWLLIFIFEMMNIQMQNTGF